MEVVKKQCKKVKVVALSTECSFIFECIVIYECSFICGKQKGTSKLSCQSCHVNYQING